MGKEEEPSPKLGVELSEETSKLLTYAVGDSGLSEDDWLTKAFLEWIKKSAYGFNRWTLGKRIEGGRRKRGGGETPEIFVIEPSEVPVSKFIPTKEDAVPDAPGWTVVCPMKGFIFDRFPFVYALNQVFEVRGGDAIRKFTAETFQDAFNEMAVNLIMDGASKEDERLIEEQAKALEDPKRKERKAEKKGKA